MLENTKKYYPVLILFVLLLADILIWFAVLNEERGKELKVAFLDVGQGDAIYIEAPNGNQLLVDGGPDGRVIEKISETMPVYDRSIDILLATHPDKDHIGGLPFVLDRYKVDNVFVSGAKSDTAVYKTLEEKIGSSGAREITARRGMRVRLSRDVYFDILSPDFDTSNVSEKNEASIVGRLVYKNESFLLTGDAPKNIESHLVSLGGQNMKSNVLKLGHHGSRTSTGENFLGSVSPKYAIISAGCNNSYGHPHKETLDLLIKYKIPKISTCESGTIVFETDGEKLSYKIEK